MKNGRLRSTKPRITAVGTRCADNAISLYPQKSTITSPTSGDRTIGIIRLRTKGHAMFFSFFGIGQL
jgi:hypothetical protein